MGEITPKIWTVLPDRNVIDEVELTKIDQLQIVSLSDSVVKTASYSTKAIAQRSDAGESGFTLKLEKPQHFDNFVMILHYFGHCFDNCQFNKVKKELSNSVCSCPLKNAIQIQGDCFRSGTINVRMIMNKILEQPHRGNDTLYLGTSDKCV